MTETQTAGPLTEDAIRLIRDTVLEAMRHGGPTAQKGSLRIPEDERLRAVVEDIIERKLTAFERRFETIVHSEIEDTLRRIGLRIDDEHIDETAEIIRSMLRTHKLLNRIATTSAITLALGIFYGILKMLGLQVPLPGGDH